MICNSHPGLSKNALSQRPDWPAGQANRISLAIRDLGWSTDVWEYCGQANQRIPEVTGGRGSGGEGGGDPLQIAWLKRIKSSDQQAEDWFV
ncbi:hypothetical protein ACFMBG_08010 [Leisingera sp. D0M16]